MLNVVKTSDFWEVIRVQKVDMVGKPADSEYDNKNHKHFDNLKWKYNFI